MLDREYCFTSGSDESYMQQGVKLLLDVVPNFDMLVEAE